MKSPTQGSQYLLRAAVNRRPELLCSALRECGALGGGQVVEWHSPLPGKYQEFRDGAALRALGLENRIKAPLGEFWPSRGPVWDALGTSSDSRPLLVEAKAHIPEAVSRAKASSMASIKLIEKSLALVRKHYTRKSDADWTAPFYQYANRLAYQYWLRERNGIAGSLVFLCFTNAKDMNGPSTEEEWHGALRLIHAVLGLPAELRGEGVYHAFLDARRLGDVGTL
jgi:hypothetical protein